MHIPVQSGSDAVLYSMKREYTNSDFCQLVDILLSKVPDISIATDVIAGYPSETEDDWLDTMKLCKKYNFPSLFINQFFPRPGTVAAKMEQIDRRIIKSRTKELSTFFKSYKTYDNMIGKIQEILVTETAFDKISLVGHNKFYQQVLVLEECQNKFDYSLMGRRLKVDIIGAEKFSLKCVVLEDISPKSWEKSFKTLKVTNSGDAAIISKSSAFESNIPGCNDCGCNDSCGFEKTSPLKEKFLNQKYLSIFGTISVLGLIILFQKSRKI